MQRQMYKISAESCRNRFLSYSKHDMKNITILSTLTLVMALFSSSCTRSTPQTRISKNPQLFEKLPSKQKELVQRGQVSKGMHKDGVYLAWGKPARVAIGYKNNKSYENWVYTRSVPVYNHGFHTNYGYGWGRYWRGPRYGVGFSPNVTYVSKPASAVIFNNSKVVSWEALR